MDYLIMCRSLTYAQRVAYTLERAGIPARILRSPAAISPKGCSYSVRVGERQLSRAMSILAQKKLPYLGIYVGRRGDGYREVEL
jgi:hypothetical protein